MLRLLKGCAAPIAVLALLGAATAARADNVAFYLSDFSFGALGTDVVSSKYNPNDTLTAGSAKLIFGISNDGGSTFTSSLPGVSDSGSTPLNGQLLGQFTLSAPSGGSASSFDSANDSFSATITETLPGGGGGTASAPVSGNISYSGNGATETLNITFNQGNPIVISANGLTNTYTLQPVTLSFTGSNTPVNASASLDVNVAQVPLPKPATAGLGLIGGLGCLQGLAMMLRRRRIA